MALQNLTLRPRINFRGTLTYTQLNAKDIKSDSDFRVQRGLTMKNNILEAAGGIEFNFFKYSMNQVGFRSNSLYYCHGFCGKLPGFFREG